MAEEKKVTKKAPAKAAAKPAAKKVAAKAAPKKAAPKKTAAKKNTVTVTLLKSFFGRLPSHRATVTGLGLKRINHTVTLEDTPAVRGMINKVAYLLKVED